MLGSQYATKSLNIRRFILQETGTYNDQYLRPYNTNLDGRMQTELLETIAERPKVAASDIAVIANQFIRPSATPEAIITIPNGWSTKRIRFFLDIESTDYIGNKMHEYVVGYTDVPGVSQSLFIDPDMTFHINAISITRDIVNRTPLGNQISTNLIDTSHVLCNNNYVDSFSGSKTFGMLPENIFTRMDTMDLNDGATSINPNDFVYDTSGILNRSAIKSNRRNNIVPQYTSNILSAYMTSLTDEAYDVSKTRELASTLVRSDSTRSDTFMSFLKSRGDLSTNSVFKLRDLEALDPNVPNVTNVIPTNAGYANNLHQSGMTASWAGSDMTTLFATSLSQAVPSYMLGYTINKIHLFSTNMDFSNTMNTTVVKCNAFNEGPDLQNRIVALISKLENELLRGLTYNAAIAYSLEMSVDLLGETWIKISLNGEPITDYVCPSFADGLMSPVITQNEQVITSIASDFDNVLQSVGRATNNVGFKDNMFLGVV